MTFLKGMIPWNKNKKGIHLSPKSEFKKGQKNYWSGKKNPQKSEQQRGSKNPMFGKIPWNKNISLPEKTKEKIRKAHLLRGTNPPSQLGKTPSIKTRKKISKSLKKEKCYNWKNGATPKNKRIRDGVEIRLWREKVFKRDNYTCQKTMEKGGRLEAHHIQNFAEYPELRFDVNNGITLSKQAHDEFHKIYGKRNNTREQLIEFLKK